MRLRFHPWDSKTIMFSHVRVGSLHRNSNTLKILLTCVLLRSTTIIFLIANIRPKQFFYFLLYVLPPTETEAYLYGVLKRSCRNKVLAKETLWRGKAELHNIFNDATHNLFIKTFGFRTWHIHSFWGYCTLKDICDTKSISLMSVWRTVWFCNWQKIYSITQFRYFVTSSRASRWPKGRIAPSFRH